MSFKVYKAIGAMTIAFALSMANTAFSEDLQHLLSSGKFDKVIEAGEKIPTASRTVSDWLALGSAYGSNVTDPKAKEKALTCFTEAQKVNPSDPEIYLALGQFEAQNKNFSAALPYYQKSYVLQRSASSAEGIAVCASALKDFEKARDAAESAIALDSNVIESRLILAQILFDKKDFKSAAPQLEFIVSKKSNSVDYWKQLAACYLATDEKNKLAIVDPQIIRLDAKDIKSRQRLADYALENNDFKTASVSYKELALLTPNDPKPFRNLYALSLKDDNKKDATQYLKNYLLLDSSDAAYQKQLGDLLFEAGDLDGALNAYRSTLKINPNSKSLFQNYATITLKKNLTAEALQVINKAILVKEADAQMYTAAGDIYKKEKNYVNAIKMYQGALELNKKDIKTLTSLGECQAASGDLKNAVITYQQVVLLNPSATNEYKILGDLIIKSGKESQGMETYKTYLDRVPSDQEITSQIGLYQYRSKDYQKSIEYLARIKDPKYLTVDVLFAMGDANNQLKNCKQAIDCFEKVKQMKPSDAILSKTLKPLAECYDKSGDANKAAEAYNAYTKLPGVKDAEASYLKAYLREKSDLETAIKMYDANTKEYPKDYRSFLRLGMIFSKDNATLGASAAQLRAASLLVDTIPAIWQTLGEVNGKLKNEEGEFTAYKKLLVLQPQDKIANKRVGTILISRKQFPSAIANLEVVLIADPKDLETHLTIADGYEQTNRPKEAAGHLKKAKELKPDDVSIRLNLIEVLDKAGDKEGVANEKASLADLDEKIVAGDKKNIESRQRLVTYSLISKNAKTAYSLLNDLAVLTPKDAKVFKNLYDITLADGKKKEATENLKKYLALKPENAEAQKDLGNLLYEQNDFDGALEAYRAARKLDLGVKGIYKNYIAILITKNNSEELIVVINAAIAAKEADAKAYAVLGDIYKKKAQYADAVKMYKGALDTDTKNIAVLASMGDCQAKAGDLKNAIITLEQVVLLNPSAANEYKQLGELQAKLGNIDQSMSSNKKYLERIPTDEELASKVGSFDHQKKQYKSAIQYFELVKSPQLRTLDFYVELGDCYYQIDNYTKAADAFDKVWKSKSATPALLKSILKPLALCYEKTNQSQYAAEAYNAYTSLPGVVDADASFKKAYLREKADEATAIKMYSSNTKYFPKDSRNFVRLGMLLSEKKDSYDQAATMLTEAVRLVDTMPDVWLKLAHVNGNLHRIDGELAAYKKYLIFRPQDLGANSRVGEILLEKKQYSEAITYLEMVLMSQPNKYEVLLLLSDAYENTNRHEKTMELLVKAKQQKSNDGSVREKLYKMYKKDGQKVKAEQEIKELVDLTKDNKFRILYFKELIDAQKYQDASDIAQQVRASDPLNFDGLMAVATIQRLQRKFGEAVESYKSVLYVKDNYAPALYGRGEAHLGLGEIDRAISFYQKALEADPKLAVAVLGLAKAAKLQKMNDLYIQNLNKAKLLDPSNKEIQDECKLAGIK